MPVRCYPSKVVQKLYLFTGGQSLLFRKDKYSNIHYVACSAVPTSMQDAICVHEKMETLFAAIHYTCYTKWDSALHDISLQFISSLWKMVFNSVLFLHLDLVEMEVLSRGNLDSFV